MTDRQKRFQRPLDENLQRSPAELVKPPSGGEASRRWSPTGCGSRPCFTEIADEPLAIDHLLRSKEARFRREGNPKPLDRQIAGHLTLAESIAARGDRDKGDAWQCTNIASRRCLDRSEQHQTSIGIHPTYRSSLSSRLLKKSARPQLVVVGLVAEIPSLVVFWVFSAAC